MARINIEVEAAVQEALRALGQLQGGFSSLSQVANRDAAGALGVFGVSLTKLNNPLTLGAELLKTSIDTTTKYASTVRDMSRNLGIGAEETSKLIQVSDDYKISSDSLQSALQMAVKKGFEPSIDSIAKLADEYNALESPTERAAMLAEKFGKNWSVLTPLLQAGGQAIRDQANAVDASLIMTQANIDKTRQWEVAVDNLTDKLEAVKMTIGTGVIPTLTSAAEATDTLLSWNKKIDTAFSQHKTTVAETAKSYSEYETEIRRSAKASGVWSGTLEEANAVIAAHNDISSEFQRRVILMTEAEFQATNTTAGYNAALMQIGPAINNYGTKTQQATTDTMSLDEAQQLLAASLGGKLGPAYSDLNGKQAGAREELVKTQKELDKYIKYQGQTVTVTKDATTSAAEMAVAYDKQVNATSSLSNAQKKLSENTDPDKQFQLQAAVNSAALGLEHADAAVGKFADGLGASSTATVDNSKKIDELTQKKNALKAAIDAADAAEQQLTNSFIFNQAAASLDASAQLELAKNMGLIDHASYNAAKGVMNITDKFTGPDGAITNQAAYSAALIQASKDMTMYGVVLDTQISPKAQVASDAIRYMNQSVAATEDKTPVFDTSAIPGPAHAAADEVIRLNDAMAKAQDKLVHFTLDYSITGATEAAGALGYVNAHQGFASGGRPGMEPHWTGEQGPELVFPDQPGFVMNNTDSMKMIQLLTAISGSVRGGMRTTNYNMGGGAGVNRGSGGGNPRAVAGAF